MAGLRIGFSSNGFAVVGGVASPITFLPQNMPDPKLPNNVIAPFWTNLSGEGTFYLATVDPDGSGTEWLVLEWKNVKDLGELDRGEYSFQIWIRVGADEEEIFMVYGLVEADRTDGFSVGAENKFGTSGRTLTELPTVETALAVKTVVPTIPGTHTITYTAKGVREGDWENCAEMTSDTFIGTVSDCAEGKVRVRDDEDDDD